MYLNVYIVHSKNFVKALITSNTATKVETPAYLVPLYESQGLEVTALSWEFLQKLFAMFNIVVYCMW